MLAGGPPTNVLVVDECRLSADALAHELQERNVTAAVATAGDAVERAASSNLDAVLVDMRQAGALRLVHELAMSAGARVVAVGIAEDNAVACAEVGAIAAVPSSATLDELLEVLESVVAGRAVFPPSVVPQLVKRLAAITGARSSSSLPSGVTRRELQVLELIDDGLSNKEIALRLNVELQTVKNHVHNILRKLDVHRRTQAAAAFRATGVGVATGTEVLRVFVDRS
jgi:two-component system, NarL family, nitrate/nitrite response regulator NarL